MKSTGIERSIASKRGRRRRPREERLKATSTSALRKAARDQKSNAERERQERRHNAPRRSDAIEKPDIRTDLAAAGIRREEVLAPDGSRPIVETRLPFSMRGLQQQHIEAARRFSTDWETAYSRGLACRGFEPGVDGGKAHGAHLRAVDASDRIRSVHTQVGKRDFSILVAVVILNKGPSEIHAAGGPQHVVISSEIKRILGAVAGCYSGRPVAQDPLQKAVEQMIRAWETENLAEANAVLREIVGRA